MRQLIRMPQWSGVGYTFIDEPDDWLDWEKNFVDDMQRRALHVRRYSTDDYAHERTAKLEDVRWVRFDDGEYEGPCVVVESILDAYELRPCGRGGDTFCLRPGCRAVYIETPEGCLVFPEQPLIPSWLWPSGP